MPAILRTALLTLTLNLIWPAAPLSANVITDWDTKAVAFVGPIPGGAMAQRELAMVHIAMFDAVNSSRDIVHISVSSRCRRQRPRKLPQRPLQPAFWRGFIRIGREKSRRR